MVELRQSPHCAAGVGAAQAGRLPDSFCICAEMVLARNKAVEGCLEAHGLAVKDLHPPIPPVDISTEWAYGRSPTRSDAHVRLNSGEWWRLSCSIAIHHLVTSRPTALSPAC